MQRFNPPSLMPPPAHAHVTIVPPASHLAFIAGQVALTKEGEIVGKGDLRAQIECCYRNLRAAVRDLGATDDDIARIMIYAVDYTPDQLPIYYEAAVTAFDGNAPITATSLVGISRLGIDDFLVEIEATVALPNGPPPA